MRARAGEGGLRSSDISRHIKKSKTPKSAIRAGETLCQETVSSIRHIIIFSLDLPALSSRMSRLRNVRSQKVKLYAQCMANNHNQAPSKHGIRHTGTPPKPHNPMRTRPPHRHTSPSKPKTGKKSHDTHHPKNPCTRSAPPRSKASAPSPRPRSRAAPASSPSRPSSACARTKAPATSTQPFPRSRPRTAPASSPSARTRLGERPCCGGRPRRGIVCGAYLPRPVVWVAGGGLCGSTRACWVFSGRTRLGSTRCGRGFRGGFLRGRRG